MLGRLKKGISNLWTCLFSRKRISLGVYSIETGLFNYSSGLGF